MILTKLRHENSAMEQRDFLLESEWWNAVSTWEQRSGRKWEFCGLDMAELSRFYLWDKVSRAIRQKHRIGPIDQELEQLSRNHALKASRRKLQLMTRVRNYARRRFARDVTGPIPTNSIMVPNAHPRLGATCEALSNASVPLLLGGGDWRPSNETCFITRMPHLQFTSDHLSAARFASQMSKSLDRTLRDSYDIALVRQDLIQFETQIRSLTNLVQRTVLELNKACPALLLLPCDNHPPFQVYVLAARNMGIRTLMLQHGLDCEHRCLEEAFASDIAVWSPSRKARYRQNSVFQPNMKITGNPEWDWVANYDFQPPEDNSILWITRPHSAVKCYSVGRLVDEGNRILNALLVALRCSPDATLFIKPHPMDDLDSYRRTIAESKLEDRITIETDNLYALIAKSRIVVTEDSTAGVEAIFWKRTVVHAHFSDTPPVVPFTMGGNAFPGFSPDQLVDSIKVAMSESTPRIPQANFLEDIAGPLDGRCGERVVSMSLECL